MRYRSRKLLWAPFAALVASVALAGFSGLAGVGQSALLASSSAPSVLRVGTYHGIAGQYRSIQAAVDAAKPGDWILVAPGDYKTTSSRAPLGQSDMPSGVLITTPGIWVRGMDRNTVVVDGTKSGPPCSTATKDQNFGPSARGGNTGLNGIMVWKASDVWVENLTTCNFLGGSGGDGQTGNEIWWNGGANSGQVFSGTGYWGNYLTATSTYFDGETTAAAYGIFSSNWNGGSWDEDYASNFNDSGFYIGACQNECNQTVDHAWTEYNALGYSGSNSGGNMLIENSQFDHNQDGFDTNSQNGDNPPPQNGACPGGGTSPITHTHSCWIFMDNYVHDNNDPNVPTAGTAGAGPVGTGMSLSGARNDTVMNNTFENNDAWGSILVPYPDSGPPCSGGTQLQAACWFDEYGDAVVNNKYLHNGGYGNPTNGDIGAVNAEPGPTDCFSGNTDLGGALTTSPPGAQSIYPKCTGNTVPPDANGLFADEVACDAESISIGPVAGGTLCPPGANYPRQTKVVMHPLPGAKGLEEPSTSSLPTMQNPCSGVPANPWCPGSGKKQTAGSARVDSAHPFTPGVGGPGASALPAPWRPRASRRV